MKLFALVLTTLVMLLPTVGFAQTPPTMYLPIIRVVDGDTIETHYNNLPPPLDKIYIRVRGIDTPESTFRAKCGQEQVLGQQAKEFLTSTVQRYKRMVVSGCQYDKYGGRWVCSVRVGTTDLTTLMLGAGYARPYNGGIKSNWCTQ